MTALFIHAGKYRVCFKLRLVCNNYWVLFFLFAINNMNLEFCSNDKLSNCNFHFSHIKFVSEGHFKAYFYWAIGDNLFNEALRLDVFISVSAFFKNVICEEAPWVLESNFHCITEPWTHSGLQFCHKWREHSIFNSIIS